jgi:hypothetical protein
MQLVKFSSDWADEFTAEGFALMTDEEAETHKEYFSKPRTFFFGTNEGWEDEEFEFTYTEVTEEEAALLKKLIPDLERTTSKVIYEGKEYTFTNGGDFGQFPRVSEDDEDEQ